MRFAAVCCLALAGCMHTTPKDETPASSGASPCGKEAYADLVGEPVANHNFGGGDGSVRIIYPGMAVTMDHRPDRLNVDVNRDGDIARLYCG